MTGEVSVKVGERVTDEIPLSVGRSTDYAVRGRRTLGKKYTRLTHLGGEDCVDCLEKSKEGSSRDKGFTRS